MVQPINLIPGRRVSGTGAFQMYDYYTAEDDELIEEAIEEPDGQEFMESLMFNGFDR